MIRVMLVDDHEVVRTGLRAFIESQEGLQVTAEAGSGAAALQIAPLARPDVIVMDISMPEMDGLEATRRLKELAPESKVLALTVHADKQYFFEMLAAGAVGYVTKKAAGEDLVAAIRAVATGSVYLQPALAAWLLEDYRRLLAQAGGGEGGKAEAAPVLADPYLVAHPDLDVLSGRERQVLEGVAEGHSNQYIGERLGISPKTVARHRERIMNKLNLHSCTELVKFAIRTGLIDLH